MTLGVLSKGHWGHMQRNGEGVERLLSGATPDVEAEEEDKGDKLIFKKEQGVVGASNLSTLESPAER